MDNAPKFHFYNGELTWIEPNGNREIVIPIPIPMLELTDISSTAFGKCQNVESIIFPKGITNLQIGLSRCCESLKKIVLPSTLKTIGKGIFEDLDTLETVILSEGIEGIGESAFKNCTALKNINFPSSLRRIEKAAFECCASLESVTLPKEIRQIDAEAFKDCPRLTFSFEENMSEKKKAELSALLPNQYTIYEVCTEDMENTENVKKLSLNGCHPFYHDGDIEIRTVAVSREKFLELFQQTRPYHILYGFCNDRSNASCRSVRPNEVVYRGGKFYGIRAIYNDQGEYCDRTWAWIREPSEIPFILEIGKDAQTHVSCFCKLTIRPDFQSEETKI